MRKSVKFELFSLTFLSFSKLEKVFERNRRTSEILFILPEEIFHDYNTKMSLIYWLAPLKN